MALKLHIFALLAALTVTLAQEAPQLTIQPENPTIRWDRNKMGFVTCKVSPKHAELTTDIVWLDPSGAEVPDERQNRIHSSSKGGGKIRELYVTKVQDEDSGTYTCKARYGSNQEISKSFTLLVYMGIRWEDAPLRQNPVRGTDALVRCVVRANPPAIIEWFRGADIIESGGRYSVQKDGLLIRNVSSGDDGTYTCRAKVPDEGEMEERFIEVEVFSPPVISVPEPDAQVIVTEDEAGITRCMAAGKPAPTRSWVTADGTDASEIDGISVDAADGTLRFEPARRSMAGEYRCVASNQVSTVETTVRVVVRVKPEVVRYENVTASEGSSAQVKCGVTGSPLPSVWFRRVGSDVSFEQGVSSQDGRISVQQTERDLERVGVLTISSLSREDGGQYECVATNVGGQTAQLVQLTVQYPPALTAVSASEVFTWAEVPAALVCGVQAAPAATLVWKYGGRPVEGDPQLVVEDMGAESMLTISPTDSDYFGKYTCEASNELGSSTLEFQLREATAPGQIINTSVRELTATSVEFDLAPPEDDGGRKVQRYLIQYVIKGKPWPSNVEVAHPAGGPYTVWNLTPQQTYLFRFAAENAVGLGAWSEPLERTMPKIDVPQPPAITTEQVEESPAALQNLQDPPVVPSSLPDSYLLSWQPGADNGAEIEDFQVSYYKVINNKNKWRVVSPKHTSVVAAAGELSFRLSSLKPESFYRVELRARNRIGLGDPAQIIVHTAPGVVVAPATSTLASSLVIGVVVGVLLVLVLLVDLTCYAVNNRGITHMLCSRGSSQTAKLSDEAASEKEPLQTNGSDSKNAAESNGERAIRLPRQTSV